MKISNEISVEEFGAFLEKLSNEELMGFNLDPKGWCLANNVSAGMAEILLEVFSKCRRVLNSETHKEEEE